MFTVLSQARMALEVKRLDLQQDRLLKLWHLMDMRNQELGWARYDSGDVQSLPFMLQVSRHSFGRIFVKASQIPELIAPIIWRRLLGVPKKVVPSVFYHCGMAYLGREQVVWGMAFDPERAEDVCREALAHRCEGKHVCWEHPYKYHATAFKKKAVNPKVPPSCAHHTCRVGLMLLRVGQAHNRDDLIEAGASAAQALLDYHRWHVYDDGTCAMSYYPFTEDEVINTSADAAVLLASLPAGQRTEIMQSRLDGIVKMLAAEQHPDGSWDYCTWRHYETSGGECFIDNHHSAMNVAGLAHVLASGSISPQMHQEAQKTLENGLRFYLEAFYLPDGTGLYFPGRGRRTSVVGYCEGVSALCACLCQPRLISSELAAKAADLLPRILARAMGNFLDPSTGDVASYRFFGRPYYIQSARWGSAPLMQAITDYLNYKF